MEEWRIYAKKADFEALAKEFDIDPVIARVIRNRDYKTSDEYRAYLFGDMSCLCNPELLPDAHRGAEVLLSALREKKAVKIIGDYDIDGICSVVILYKTLEKLGFQVGYDVPNRIIDGYGLNKRLVEKAHDEGFQVILTCDNGIAAFDEIAYARSLGMDVVVTDHHEVPLCADGVSQKLVDANAVIDPKRGDSEYPFPEICGAVVAMKFMQVLCKEMNAEFDESLIEFAAIATIGDVMKLVGENRIIVKEGFKSIAKSKNKALLGLIRTAGVDPEKINSYDVGFRIGPCLNSSGRLKDAMYAVDMFLSDDEKKAANEALFLTELNNERKSLTQSGADRCFELLDSGVYGQDKVFVILLENTHESLAGIIAGRVKERYNHPVIVFTRGEECIKGSGRSIEQYDMFKALSTCRDLFTKFGGHAMAAGISMPEANLDEFRRRINAECTLTEADFVKKIWIDSKLPFGYISKKLINDTSLLEPYGVGNPKPKFGASNVTVESIRLVGKDNNVVKLRLRDDAGILLDGVCFDADMYKNVALKDRINIIFNPQLNTYMGNESIQICVESYRKI